MPKPKVNGCELRNGIFICMDVSYRHLHKGDYAGICMHEFPLGDYYSCTNREAQKEAFNESETKNQL